MNKPFTFAAGKTNVRGYSIGPDHTDWLCVKCGHVKSNRRPGPWFLIGGQPYDKQRHAKRELIEHLQTHVRWESVELVSQEQENEMATPTSTEVEQDTQIETLGILIIRLQMQIQALVKRVNALEGK